LRDFFVNYEHTLVYRQFPQLIVASASPNPLSTLSDNSREIPPDHPPRSLTIGHAQPQNPRRQLDRQARRELEAGRIKGVRNQKTASEQREFFFNGSASRRQ
jgi:hypothetical protein